VFAPSILHSRTKDSTFCTSAHGPRPAVRVESRGASVARVSATWGVTRPLRRSRSFRRLSRLIAHPARFYLGLEFSNDTIQETKVSGESCMGDFQEDPFLDCDGLCQIKRHFACLVHAVGRGAIAIGFLRREQPFPRFEKLRHETSIARRATQSACQHKVFLCCSVKTALS
jgi:hypothetical protein